MSEKNVTRGDEKRSLRKGLAGALARPRRAEALRAPAVAAAGAGGRRTRTRRPGWKPRLSSQTDFKNWT